MTTEKKHPRWSRWAGLGLAAALLLALSGDGLTQAASLAGIDPLDVLDLQVKPNVFVVLDSSGSMQENLYRNSGGGAVNLNVGDWRESKMGLAKSVLKQVITSNATKANFLLGQYTINNSVMQRTGLNDGNGRFRYLTNVDWNDNDNDNVFDAAETTISGSQTMRTACPGATTTTPCELTMPARGFQAWQWIEPGWNTLYFTEGAVSCARTIPTGFYRTQANLEAALEAAMNSCPGRPGTPNTYDVTPQSNGRFRFARSGGGNNWTLQWATGGPSNIAGALSAYSGTTGTPQQPTYANVNVNGGNYTTQNSIQLLWRDAGYEVEEVDFDPDGSGPLATRDRTTYYFRANKAWNGELFYVDGAGAVCGFDATSPAKTDPPSFRVQQVSNCTNPTGSTVGSVVTFEWGGGVYGGNNVSCNGFQTNVKLPKCDAEPPSNIDLITSNLELQFGIDHATTSPTFGNVLGYAERPDGTHQIQTLPAPAGIHADGSTPIANSLIAIRPIFSALWFTGQADDPVTAFDETRGPIRDQTAPRERTIILFVTDGDDTCANGGSGSDDNAKRAAHKAEVLFNQLEAGFPESSVTTYSIGFGTGASTARLNWIGWGGSGLGQGAAGQPNVTTTGSGNQERWSETTAQLAAKRSLCTTCIDAFIAPDAATLAAQLQSILDQGATLGEFTAQQSVFGSVFELVKEFDNPPTAPADPDDPETRYRTTVPNLFRASFTMPGFKGQFRALQNKGTIVENWNAGQKLFDRVNAVMASCNDSGTLGECNFASLLTRIDRRIYTSSSNGVFPADVSDLTSETWLTGNGNRTVLWPPSAAVAPTNNVTVGSLDAALGLPLTNDDPTFNQLVAAYGACAGTPLNGACTGAQPAKTQRARRESRERILAFMAGAQTVFDGTTGLPRRTGTGEMVFSRRDWMLADTTLAVPAVMGPPIQALPVGTFEAEYLLFRDSVGDTQSANDAAARLGFGLRNHEDGVSPALPSNPNPSPPPAVTYVAAQPSMTVAFVPANDMLHAFRAGPSCNVPPYTSCAEQGGVELWGFVPFDQLAKLQERLLIQQTRANHTYMLAASARFADVFVPNPGTASNQSGAATTITVAGTSQTINGVWRRVLYFGRGIGGKFITALDVTTAGDYKTTAASSIPPVVLWSRGNPDTDPDDAPSYAKMGQTWSVPTVSLADRASNTTSRKSAGVDFVLYVGSGYGDTSGCGTGGTCEGQTFFTLDALTGDVVAAADVPAAAGTPTGGYANALVANVAAFNPAEFGTAAGPIAATAHPASSKPTRVYIGDLHGRVWKFLTSSPGTPFLLTDLGIEQPIAAPVALLAFDESGTLIPYVYVNSGYDRRQDPTESGEAFLLAGIKDDQAGDVTPSNACQQSPVVTPCLFARELTQQIGADIGYFRGTLQPATVLANNGTLGRVFFAATRFNPPAPEGAPFAPDPPPCKSSFDSVLYALGAKTGEAAFDLNASPTEDDAYIVYDNSKIAGIGIIAAPDGSGGTSTQLTVDEGLMSGTGGGGAGGNCTGGEGPDCIPPGGPTPGTTGGSGGTGGVIARGYRPSSTICQ